MEENYRKKVGKFWDGELTSKASRMHWWKSPIIIRHYNHTVCGEYLDGWNAGPLSLLGKFSKGRIFERALSIGCGTATKELDLLQKNFVKHFTCFELSQDRIRMARTYADEMNLSDRITFICDDFFNSEYIDKKFDLVFWDNSLHHMENTEYAVEVSNDVLEKDGFLFCNDYVGPSRFQLSDIEVALINGIRAELEDSIFDKKIKGGGMYPRRYKRPDVKHMLETDPSEAADSANILPAIRHVFNKPLIINTGGLIYHLGLNNILQNIDEESELLQWLLQKDDEIIKLGFYHYAFALAVKN